MQDTVRPATARGLRMVAAGEKQRRFPEAADIDVLPALR